MSYILNEEELLSIYPQLRSIARMSLHNCRYMNRTLGATSLVNEAWIKLATSAVINSVENRRHFISLAAKAMRHLIIDEIRKRNSVKRFSEAESLDNDVHELDFSKESGISFEETLSINKCLEQLEFNNAELVEIVELRFFLGMTEDEIAEFMGVNKRTITRKWVRAKEALLLLLN